MTLLFSASAEAALQALHARTWPANEVLRLTRALIYLEDDASGFEAMMDPTVIGGLEMRPGAGPLRAIVLEADPGSVFVVQYRLVDDAEDVWIENLGYGQ